MAIKNLELYLKGLEHLLLQSFLFCFLSHRQVYMQIPNCSSRLAMAVNSFGFNAVGAQLIFYNKNLNCLLNTRKHVMDSMSFLVGFSTRFFYIFFFFVEMGDRLINIFALNITTVSMASNLAVLCSDEGAFEPSSKPHPIHLCVSTMPVDLFQVFCIYIKSNCLMVSDWVGKRQSKITFKIEVKFASLKQWGEIECVYLDIRLNASLN